MEEWIHVDERLPDTEDTMVVFIQCPGHTSLSRVETGWLCEGKMWCDPIELMDLEISEECAVGEIIKHVVTHWRPFVERAHPTTGIL